MKYYSILTVTAASLLTGAPSSVLAQDRAPSLIYETPHEFFAGGDFDADGRTDVVIVDKESGKYRLGYQLTPGTFSWVDCRPSGLKGVAGFGLGQLLATNQQALAFTSPDANQIIVADVSSATAPGAAGDGAVYRGARAEPGRPGGHRRCRQDRPGRSLCRVHLQLARPEPRRPCCAMIGAEFPKLAEATLAGPAVRGNRLAAQGRRSPSCSACSCAETRPTRCASKTCSSGNPVVVATVANLPAGSDYAVGNFRGSPLRDFIFYKPGDNSLTVRPVEEPRPGSFSLAQGQSFDLDQPVQRVIALDESGGKKLFVIFGEGEKAGVFDFDGAKAPVLVQSLPATNYLFTCAASLPGGLHCLFRAGRRQVLHALPDLQGRRRRLRRRAVRQPGVAGGQRQHHHP